MEDLFITKRLRVYVYCINTHTVCLDKKYQTINVSPTAWWTGGYGAGRASKLLSPFCHNESYLFQKWPKRQSYHTLFNSSDALLFHF